MVTDSKRLLWDYTADSKAKDSCKDVTFGSKPSNPSDAMMDNIMEQRKGDKPLKKFASDGDAAKYGMTLLQYCAPWAVLFIFSLFG